MEDAQDVAAEQTSSCFRVSKNLVAVCFLLTHHYSEIPDMERIYSSALTKEVFRLLLQKYFYLSKVLIYYSRTNSPALINPAFRSMLTWFHVELISFSIIQH